MFFQKVFELAHHTLEDYMRQAPLGWNSWFQHPVWAVPLVHCESSFFFPLISGESLRIELILDKTTESSLTFFYNFTQNQKLCCKVTTTHVFINKETKEKIPIPRVISDLWSQVAK